TDVISVLPGPGKRDSPATMMPERSTRSDLALNAATVNATPGTDRYALTTRPSSATPRGSPRSKGGRAATDASAPAPVPPKLTTKDATSTATTYLVIPQVSAEPQASTSPLVAPTTRGGLVTF